MVSMSQTDAETGTNPAETAATATITIIILRILDETLIFVLITI